jgi:hypothetical protein
VERIVTQIRKTWPNVRIVLRADSGFARDNIGYIADKPTAAKRGGGTARPETSNSTQSENWPTETHQATTL